MIENHEPIWFNNEPRNTDKKKAGYSLFVATPVHSDVSMHYTQSLLKLQKYCMEKNVDIHFQLMKSSLVTQGRNMCVAEFLKSNSTHLLFIDSDIAFNQASAERLVAQDKDVISIPYPLKDMNWDKLIEAYPDLRIDQDQIINGKNVKLEHMWNFFDTQFDKEKHTYSGEDFAFCKRWKDIGGTCHAWIMDYITHVGEHQYTGRFADELILPDK